MVLNPHRKFLVTTLYAFYHFYATDDGGSTDNEVCTIYTCYCLMMPRWAAIYFR